MKKVTFKENEWTKPLLFEGKFSGMDEKCGSDLVDSLVSYKSLKSATLRGNMSMCGLVQRGQICNVLEMVISTPTFMLSMSI